MSDTPAPDTPAPDTPAPDTLTSAQLPYDWVIQDTTVYDPASRQTLEHHDIAIRGPHIAEIAPTGTLTYGDASILDGCGQVALPGLINCHAHSAMTLFRGVAEDVDVMTWFNDIIWRLETNLSPEDVYWGAKLAAIEMVEAGVTTVSDHYFFADEVARAFLDVGLRAHIAPTLFDAAGAELDQALQTSQDFVNRWQHQGKTSDKDDVGRIRVWLGPHSPYLCSGEMLTEVKELAKSLDIGVHLHVSETKTQVEMSLERHGQTPVSHLEQLGLFDVPVLCAHATHATKDDITLLAHHDAGVAHCPKTFLKLASGIADVTDMLAKGVAVGLGTDGPASNNTLDIFEQMRLTAMLQKHEQEDATVLRRHEVLELATAGAANVLREPQLGKLQAGYLADIILVSLDEAHIQPVHNLAAALVYSASARDVQSVMVHGEVLMQRRVLTKLDKQEVLEQVKTRAYRLRESTATKRLQTFPGETS
jgi:5-methylthioadenosine/S-adenosylhomocysteine deaminase